MKFVNLYLQTEYSMLQSACKIVPTIEAIKKYGFEQLAITDDTAMHGVIKFYQGCHKRDIKPIIGLKIHYSFNGQISCLLLYAMNNFGYKNLMRIATYGKLHDNIIDFEYLNQNTLGLLVIIPYSEHLISHYFELGSHKDIISQINFLKVHFSPVYVGLSNSSLKESRSLPMVYAFLKENQIDMVALSRITFINMEDSDVLQTLLSIKNGGNLQILSEEESNSYLYTNEEITMKFNGYEELIANTQIIADKCNVKIDFDKYHLPKYQENLDAKNYLKELCLKGLQKRLIQNQITNDEPYYERLQYELGVIDQMGYNDYFLIVWDYVKFAKTQGIYVGPGRGSAAASLVSYSLGITDVNPIEYNLLFERFLNIERISMPDIDIDFPDDERDQVIRYVGKKYGHSRVAHIVTFGTFKAKMALRDAVRVHKLSEVRFNQLLKEVNSVDQRGFTPLQQIVAKSPNLQAMIEDYEDIAKIINVAIKLEGLPRNTSTHAAGILITHYDLVNYTPLDNGLNDIYQTQYEASDLEALGLLKMDFLGLKNLTNINKTIKLIKKSHPQFEMPLKYDDGKTLKMIASGDVQGVFQLESDGMRKVLMELRVSSFDDIVFAIALYRPGPMEIIPTFIKRKFKQEVVVYPHPDLEDILQETYGTIVYQEQILLIAQKFAGYSLGKADVLRRAISKKKLDVLEEERRNFIASSKANGYDEKTAGVIYDYIVKFADYGFNKAHSVPYAKVAYLTAFLKCHYSQFYFSTLMTSVIGSSSDTNLYYQEARRKGVHFTSLNINLSRQEYVVVNDQVVFPLLLIKGLGTVKCLELITKRDDKPFDSFEDFVIRTKDICAPALVENIIYSGALDLFKHSKKSMIDNYNNIIKKSEYNFIDGIIEVDYQDEEFGYGYLLQKEKEITGINIKYNFFEQYEYLYKRYNLQKINTIKEKEAVKTIGIIKQIKMIKTKNGEAMAFMKVSDDTTTIDVTLFPKMYAKYPQLTLQMVVVIFGMAEKRNEINIIANEIEIV